MTWSAHSAALAAEVEPKTVIVLVPAGSVQVGLPAGLLVGQSVAIPAFEERKRAGLGQAMLGARMFGPPALAAWIAPGAPEPSRADLGLALRAQPLVAYGTWAALAQPRGEGASGQVQQWLLAGQLALARKPEVATMVGVAPARRRAEAAGERRAAAAVRAAAATAAAAAASLERTTMRETAASAPWLQAEMMACGLTKVGRLCAFKASAMHRESIVW